VPEARLEPQRTLDYAVPAKTRRQPYWIFLFGTWILGFPVVGMLDQFLKRSLYGGSADGSGSILAMFAILPAAVVASFLPRRWWVAALLGGMCAPVAITAMYLLWR
jgi:uncharacterized membrane protein YhaH (DUF805 family)